MAYSKKTKLHKREEMYKFGNLKSIVLDVTNKCNMHCPHCYVDPFLKDKTLPLKDLAGPMQELYEIGVSHYVLAGGEPIVDFERLKAIISMTHPDETYLNVLTNGWDMNKKNIQELKKIQVDKICFSLDSGIEEEHDNFRMKDSYRRVLEGVEHVLEEGLIASVMAVVTHDSLYSEGFKKLKEYVDQKQIRFQINMAMPVGKWEGREDILLTPEDLKYIRRLERDSKIGSDGDPLVKREVFGETDNYCKAGTEKMAITASGEFLPCVFLQFSLGNIKDKSIRKMRKDLLKNDLFGKIQNHCLCAEDKEFREKFINPYSGVQKPLNAYQIFDL